MNTLITKRDFLGGRMIGGDEPFFLIAGPCVMENRELLDRVAGEMVEICKELGILYIFKSSTMRFTTIFYQKKIIFFYYFKYFII